MLDVIKAYEKACGKTLPYVVGPRRPGDIAACYADPKKAREELGWEAKYGKASFWKNNAIKAVLHYCKMAFVPL